jgi:hypothetical protein
VPELVIDLLETIKIEQHETQCFPGTLSSRRQLNSATQQLSAIA